MSEDAAGLTFPVATRTETAARRGLAAALDEIAAHRPPALVLEVPGPVTSWRAVEERIASSGVPVLAAVGPLPERDGAVAGGLDAPDDRAADAAASAFLATLPRLARLRCRRLVVPVGDGGLEGAAGVRAALSRTDDAARLVTGWRSGRRSGREAAVDRLVRRIDPVARRDRALEVLLVPRPDPLCLLDLEAAEWILEDLPGGNVGLALDVGAAGLQAAVGGPPVEAWLERLGGRTALVLLADHDGRERGDLAPGAGLLRWPGLRGLLPRGVPWVHRPDPRVPAAFLREADALLARDLGPPADPETAGYTS